MFCFRVVLYCCRWKSSRISVTDQNGEVVYFLNIKHRYLFKLSIIDNFSQTGWFYFVLNFFISSIVVGIIRSWACYWNIIPWKSTDLWCMIAWLGSECAGYLQPDIFFFLQYFPFQEALEFLIKHEMQTRHALFQLNVEVWTSNIRSNITLGGWHERRKDILAKFSGRSRVPWTWLVLWNLAAQHDLWIQTRWLIRWHYSEQRWQMEKNSSHSTGKSDQKVCEIEWAHSSLAISSTKHNNSLVVSKSKIFS